MKKHQDAQHQLEQQPPYLSAGLTSFQQLYPQVASLALRVEASPLTFGATQTYHYSLEHLPGQYCPCPHANCVGGGFDIGRFLAELIDAGATEGESELHRCIGQSTAGQLCHYSFKATAKLTYKP